MRAGGEVAPLGRVVADVALQRHRQREGARIVHERRGQDELVPRGQKAEERGHGERRARQRQHHAPEGVEARAAVEQHGLFELARQRVEVALEHEDAERESPSWRRRARGPTQAIEQVQAVEQHVERDRRDHAGEHLRDEKGAQARLRGRGSESATARRRPSRRAPRRRTVTAPATTIELTSWRPKSQRPASSCVREHVDEVVQRHRRRQRATATARSPATARAPS